MSTRMVTLRLMTASAIVLSILVTVTVLNWPQPTAAAATKTVVVTKTPPGCEKFVRSSDAFVSVTEDFLGVQNDALDAVIAFDAKSLSAAVDEMDHLQGRYDAVMNRYEDSRAGCL